MLSRVFSADNQLNDTLQNAVMMNMFYFNTPTEKGLDKISAEAKGYCLNKTLEFIQILNPKNILFLGSESNLKKFVSSIEVIENNVKRGILNNREVFIIPHYGYFGAWSLVKGAAMGNTLRRVFK